MSYVNFSSPQDGLFAEDEPAESDFGEFSSASPVTTESASCCLPAAKDGDGIPRSKRLQSCDYVVAPNDKDLIRQKSVQKSFQNESHVSIAGESVSKCVQRVDPVASSLCGEDSFLDAGTSRRICVSQTVSTRCNKQSEVNVCSGESKFDAKLPYLNCKQSESRIFPEVRNSCHHFNGISTSSGSPVSELDEKWSVAPSLDNFSRQDSNVSSSSSVDGHGKSGGTQELCDYDEFQSVLPDICDGRPCSSLHQNSNWASFDFVDVSSVSDDSWLAFQDDDDDVIDKEDSEASISSCHKEVGKLEPAVGDLFDMAFPQHAGIWRDDKRQTMSATESCGSLFGAPLLLDLIEDCSLSTSSEDQRRSPEICSSPCSSRSTSIWNSLKVMEETDALKFQWDGSHGKKLLLKSLALESPTTLNSRRVKKPSVVRTNHEVSDATKSSSCRQPHDLSFSQKVLSATHLRM